MAVSALVGKTIGAGQPERAMRITRISLLLAMAYMGTLAVIYFIWRRELIGLFNDTPAVVAIAAPLMICSVVFQLFDAAGITYHSALRGAGDTLWASIMFVVTHWLIVIGGGYAMAWWMPSLGSLGPWIAASGLIILCSLLLGIRWHSLAWMKIDLFKHDQGEIAPPAATPDAPEQAASEPLTSWS
jgi:MATE family multidrug resistance protein